ncbi:MAG: TldD/PmbA family protein [Gammaproteobacteria bacterium]
MGFFYTTDNLKAMAEKAVALARKAGASAAESRIGEQLHKEIRVRCGRLDGAESSGELGVSVCVFDGARKGAAAVGELSDNALELAVRRALELARASAADPCFGLADESMMAREFRDLALYHPHALSDDDAFDMAGRCEQAAFAAHGDISRDKSEGASVDTSASQSAYANSHGFCAAEQTTMHGISCTALAEANGAMELDGWSDSARNFDDLPSPESVGKTAGELAAARLGGRRLKSAQVPVLFRAPVSHSLVWHLVQAASGGALYRNLSWLSVDDLQKRRVCAPHINIVEDPFLPGGFGSGNFDGEGVALRRRDIVKDGIWRGCFLGSYSARRMKMQTTGNAGGAHNLIVGGRMLPFDDLLREMGRGFLATDLMGSTINPVTGDYSRGASGFWVEGGEIIHPVSEATIAGNVCDILNNIVAVGDDDNRRRGAVKCGSILVGGMTVGGQ